MPEDDTEQRATLKRQWIGLCCPLKTDKLIRAELGDPSPHIKHAIPGTTVVQELTQGRYLLFCHAVSGAVFSVDFNVVVGEIAGPDTIFCLTASQPDGDINLGFIHH